VYELVPAAEVPITLPVLPGDSMTASVAVSGDTATVKLRNNTSGESFAKSVVMTSPAPATNSAEWIMEAPLNGALQPALLVNFGKISFTSASASSVGSAGSHTGPINDHTWVSYQQLVLRGSAYGSNTQAGGSPGPTQLIGNNYAKVSPLTATGKGFTVTYVANAPASPPPVNIDITSGPPASSSNTTANITYLVGDLGKATKKTCTLDGKSIHCGTYAVTLTHLSVGKHTFVITVDTPEPDGAPDSGSIWFVVTKP
jgi:hypothetical protein